MYEFERIIEPILPDNPYLPYLAAVEHGLVEPNELTPQELDVPLGVMLANGKIPNQAAGLVLLGGRPEVCDHAGVKDISKNYREIFLSPTSKADVGQAGEIRDSGLLVLTRPNGLLKVIGIAIDLAKSNFPQPYSRKIKVKMLGLEASDYEPVDIDKEGVIRAIRQLIK